MIAQWGEGREGGHPHYILEGEFPIRGQLNKGDRGTKGQCVSNAVTTDALFKILSVVL
jgi:hypothetical protein